VRSVSKRPANTRTVFVRCAAAPDVVIKGGVRLGTVSVRGN
jgi:hypothetical protein